MSDKKKFLPWVEKYRPVNLSDIISHKHIIKSLKEIIKNGSLPHLLFHGTPGTGKTSTILSIVKKIYGSSEKFMVLELNASNDRGISSVRRDIKGFAESNNMFNQGVKLIILDEADSMTYDAQFALRRIIEEYSSNVRFCIICNYINKIILAIRSRCMLFRFSPIPIDESITILKKICTEEKIKYDIKVLKTIIKISRGDLRKTINLLQAISVENKDISCMSGYKLKDLPNPKQIDTIFKKLINPDKKFNYCVNKINELIEKNGYSLNSIITELYYCICNNLPTLKSENIGKYLIELADLEFKLVSSTFDDIYIGSLVSIFKY